MTLILVGNNFRGNAIWREIILEGRSYGGRFIHIKNSTQFPLSFELCHTKGNNNTL